MDLPTFSGTALDPTWIVVAFGLGFLGRLVGLPPLVGFLIAGFALNAMGVQGSYIVDSLADLGVTLLLFCIGLKLRIGTLARPEVWAGASLHMSITVVVFGLACWGLAAAGLVGFADLDLRTAALVAFALSFSSTVFAVKIFEDKGEMASLQGRVAIGILIMQDVIAVVFLSATSGTWPSVWAFGLLALPLLRPVLMYLMDRAGHGELLLTFGFLLAFAVGAEGFHLVGMKADLGALVLGMLVASHPRASELANTLLSVKELFLIAFFLNVGLSSTPGLEQLGIALLLSVVMPAKVLLFFWILTRFRLRARTSLLASLSLANYSEFGLIVAAVGAANGWIEYQWVTIIAMSLSITFVLAAPLNRHAHAIYDRMSAPLGRFESERRLADEQPIDPRDAEIVVLGMGRVGAGAYDAMVQRFGEVVVGIDADPETVSGHIAAGRVALLGDATDSDFWHRLVRTGCVRAVLLTMPRQAQNLYVARRLKGAGFPGLIAATALFDDDVAVLEREGVHAVFNFYAEAGLGLAGSVSELLERPAET